MTFLQQRTKNVIPSELGIVNEWKKEKTRAQNRTKCISETEAMRFVTGHRAACAGRMFVDLFAQLFTDPPIGT